MERRIGLHFVYVLDSTGMEGVRIIFRTTDLFQKGDADAQRS